MLKSNYGTTAARITSITMFILNIGVIGHAFSSVLRTYKVEFNSQVLNFLPDSMMNYFIGVFGSLTLVSIFLFIQIFSIVILSSDTFFNLYSTYIPKLIRKLLTIISLALFGSVQFIGLKLLAIESLKLDSIYAGNVFKIIRIWNEDERRNYFLSLLKDKGYESNKYLSSKIELVRGSGSLKDIKELLDLHIERYEAMIKEYNEGGFFYYVGRGAKIMGHHVLNFIDAHPAATLIIGSAVFFFGLSYISQLNYKLDLVIDGVRYNYQFTEKIKPFFPAADQLFKDLVARHNVNPEWSRFVSEKLGIHDRVVMAVLPILNQFNDTIGLLVDAGGLSEEEVTALKSLLKPESMAALRAMLRTLNNNNNIE